MNYKLILTLVLVILVVSACGSPAAVPTIAPVDSSTSSQPDYESTISALSVQLENAQNNNEPAATVAPAGNSAAPANAECTFPAPSSDLDSMPKTLIDLASQGVWFHRVFEPGLFNEANNWGGADSWFTSTLAIGPNSGGAWTSYGNPGEFIYRATEVTSSWCLGIKTTAQYKSQFMGNKASLPVAVNVRIAHDVTVYVKTASNTIKSQATSDQGDLTIILPDTGIVYIWTEFTTAAPTFESKVWFGPYDRSEFINTLDAR